MRASTSSSSISRSYLFPCRKRTKRYCSCRCHRPQTKAETRLEIFDDDYEAIIGRQKENRGMAIPGSCLSMMEKPRFWITMSPESGACLYTRKTRKKHTGLPASLASCQQWHYGRINRTITHGQCLCSTFRLLPPVSWCDCCSF